MKCKTVKVHYQKDYTPNTCLGYVLLSVQQNP